MDMHFIIADIRNPAMNESDLRKTVSLDNSAAENCSLGTLPPKGTDSRILKFSLKGKDFSAGYKTHFEKFIFCRMGSSQPTT